MEVEGRRVVEAAAGSADEDGAAAVVTEAGALFEGVARFDAGARVEVGRGPAGLAADLAAADLVAFDLATGGLATGGVAAVGVAAVGVAARALAVLVLAAGLALGAAPDVDELVLPAGLALSAVPAAASRAWVRGVVALARGVAGSAFAEVALAFAPAASGVAGALFVAARPAALVARGGVGVWAAMGERYAEPCPADPPAAIAHRRLGTVHHPMRCHERRPRTPQPDGRRAAARTPMPTAIAPHSPCRAVVSGALWATWAQPS